VRVDDRGVTRHSLIRTHSLAWDEIRDYRLTIEMRGAKLEVLYLVDWLNLALIARDVRRGIHGEHRFRLGIELLGDSERVAFNWRFRAVPMAIAQILERIFPPLAARAHAQLAAGGIARFGPLALAEHGIQWGDRPPLPREAVESVELFNSSPVRLRVMAHDKAWPYGQAETADIPNIAAALEIAERLGYRVRGRELFRGFSAAPWP
jgi:hypothetical protein